MATQNTNQNQSRSQNQNLNANRNPNLEEDLNFRETSPASAVEGYPAMNESGPPLIWWREWTTCMWGWRRPRSCLQRIGMAARARLSKSNLEDLFPLLNILVMCLIRRGIKLFRSWQVKFRFRLLRYWWRKKIETMFDTHSLRPI